MVASKDTSSALARILVQEIGRDAALQLLDRIITEVMGNQSFIQTLHRVKICIKEN